MALVVETVEVPPFLENTYVVGDDATGAAWIVDPGGAVHRLEQVLADRRWKAEAIVLTHGHIDHVAGAEEAQRRLGVPVWVHEADRRWLEELPTQARMFGFPPVPGPAPSRFLKDGEVLALGSLEARVLHTPGHTQGSLCVYFPQARAVLTGDTLFAGSIGRTDLPGGDADAIVASIRDRLFPLGDEVAFYPGHGAGGTLGRERRTNPFVGDRIVG